MNRSVKYYLVLLQAKDKSNKDISSDTVIFAVKDYYIQKKDFPNAALAAFYCGRVLHEQENMEKAIEAYNEAGNLADKTDNNNLKGLIQGNMGILHRKHSSYEKAIEFLKNSAIYNDKAENYRNKTSALKAVGDCYLLSRQSDSAFYYYNESLKLAELYSFTDLQSDLKQSLGVAYRVQGLYKNAIKLFNEALELQSDSVEWSRILLNIAQTYILENSIDSVNLYLEKVLDLQIRDPWLMRNYYLLKSKVAENNKQYWEALNCYKEYYSYTTKLFDSEKNNKLLEIQEKYDFEKLKSLNNQLVIKQQNVMLGFLLLFTAAIIISFFLFRKSVKDKRLLVDLELKIATLQKLADSCSNKNNNAFNNILLDHFNILKKTALLKTTFNEEENNNGKKLLKIFNKIVYDKDTIDWNKLYQSIDNLKDGFYSKVRNKYPHLTEKEFAICCLSCEAELSDKEIEIILGMKLNMVRRTRSDLRKKIGMPPGENFLDFFNKSIQ